MSSTFVMAGGGTGGHVIPALAVARVLRARGHAVRFIGTRRGMEAKLVPAEDFPIEWIEIGGLKRVGLRQRLSTLAELPWSVWQAARMLDRAKPAAVFSTGGFVAQQFTLDHPAMVRRMVLAGTGPEGGKGMEHYTDEVAAHALVDVPGPEDLVYLFFAPSETSQNAGVAFVERLGTRTAEPDAPTTLQVRDAQLKAVEAWGTPRDGDYKQLKSIKQPTLVINGVSDVMVPSINSLILAQNLPMGFLSLYPDAAHGALFQYPDLFANQVLSFLRPGRWV